MTATPPPGVSRSHRGRILVMPEGDILAHMGRPLEIGTALREIGCEVIFSGEGRYMHLATERGFPVVPATCLEKEKALACARSGRGNFLDDRHLRQRVEEDRRIFEEVKPDLVVGDFRMSLTISCELDSLPLAMILNGTWTKSYAVRMKAPEHFLPTRLLGPRIVDLFAPILKRSVLWWDAAPFRRYRRELGLPARTNLLDHWRGDLNLIADTPEFAPTTDLPHNYHYVGPIIWEPKIPAPAWLDDLDPGRPIIYFTMGSTGHARFFLLLPPTTPSPAARAFRCFIGENFGRLSARQPETSLASRIRHSAAAAESASNGR